MVIRKTSQIWVFIPENLHEGLITLVEQLSKVSSYWVDDQLKMTPGKMPFLERAGFPNIEPFYTVATPKSLMDYFRRLTLPIPNFSTFPKGDSLQAGMIQMFSKLFEVFDKVPQDARIPAAEAKFNENRKTEFLMRFHCFLTDMLAFANFKKTVYQLIHSAKAGDDKTFLKMVRADRNLIYSKWARQRIMKAFWSREEVFCLSLSHALQNPICFKRTKNKKYGEMLITIMVLLAGGYKLPRLELFKFLKDLGFYKTSEKNKITELETFTRTVHRFFAQVGIPIAKLADTRIFTPVR